MPIVESRAALIRTLIADLDQPTRREAALVRLRTLGPRVPAHVEEQFARLTPGMRTGLLEVLRGVNTADARATVVRLERVAGATPPSRKGDGSTARRKAAQAPPEPVGPNGGDEEAEALAALRAQPPAQARESAAISRARGEAHLALARAGSRLARKDLLHCLETLGAERARLYCEAAALIGDSGFVPALAALADRNAACGAGEAISAVAARERLSARSKAIKELEPALRTAALNALAAGRAASETRR